MSLPDDIKIMLEQMLSEDPDGIVPGHSNIRSKMGDVGIKKLGYIDPYDEDGITFICDKGFVVYSSIAEASTKYDSTHYSLKKAVAEISYGLPRDLVKIKPADKSNREAFGGLYSEREYLIVPRIYPTTSELEYVRAIDSINLKWRRLESKDVRNIGVTGRLWKSKKIISFWNKKATALIEIKLIEGFLRNIGVDPEKLVYQFIDSEDGFLYSELNGSEKSIKRSDSEIIDLMRKQHLNPDSKKKLAAISRVQQKKSPGFDFQAQKDAALPALEETEELDEFDYDVPDGVPYMFPSLEEMATETLKEDPDHMVVPGNDLKKLRSHGFDRLTQGGSEFTDWDSVCVFIDQKENRILYGVTDELGTYVKHRDMMRQIYLYRHFHDQFKITQGGQEFGLEAASFSDRKQVMFPKGSIHGVGFKSKLDFETYMDFATWANPPYRRENSDLITGRFWDTTRGMSFWDQKKKVMQHFNLVVEFFRSIKVDPKKVVYQFIDSDKVFVYDELFNDNNEAPILSPKEIAVLRKKQHTDPDAKKKLATIDKVKQVVNPGFKFQAQKDAMMPALNEDPNRLRVGPGQVETLSSHGFDVTSIKRVFFDAPGAVSFIYDIVNRVMIYNSATDGEIPMTHPDMGEQITAYLAYPDQYEIVQSPIKGTVLQPDIDDPEGPGGTQGEITFPTLRTPESLKNYLSKLDKSIPKNGSIARNSQKFLMGRLWTKQRVISFWKKREKTLPHLEAINHLIEGFGLKPSNVVFEFLDSLHLFTYNELHNGITQTRSNAEQQELMARSHFKKDDDDRENWDMKKNKGFDFQAQKDASVPALQESPDAVYSSTGQRLTGWGDYGAYAFIATYDYSVMCSQSTHHAIIRYLEKMAGEKNPEDTLNDFISIGGEVSNRHKLLSDIEDEHGFMGSFLRTERPNIRDEVGIHQTDDFLVGRIWVTKKLISFWNSQNIVLSEWSWVKKMFTEHKEILGNLKDYKVDFIEREENYESGKYPELTSAGDIDKEEDASSQPIKDENGQLNMIAQLFNKVQELPKLSDDKLKKIREKLHVLDPNVKAQVVKMLGKAGQHKAASIAEKLGMSVAEFNHLWNVNERHVKLSDLI